MASLGDRKPPDAPPGMLGRLAGAGVELAAAVAGMCLIGYWVDLGLDSSPWGLLICAVLGIVGGLYNMIRKSLTGGERATRSRRPDDIDDRRDERNE